MLLLAIENMVYLSVRINVIVFYMLNCIYKNNDSIQQPVVTKFNQKKGIA